MWKSFVLAELFAGYIDWGFNLGLHHHWEVKFLASSETAAGIVLRSVICDSNGILVSCECTDLMAVLP